MMKVTKAVVRVSKGLVLWVAAGVQREKCYWPTCEGLMWEWWKAGNQLWRPCIWWKVDDKTEGGSAIPGSGGKQWLRNDWEYVMAFKKEGWLPFADNTAMGGKPKYANAGGELSYRTLDGQRINKKVSSTWQGGPSTGGNGAPIRPRKKKSPLPARCNPGNVVKARVGGGHIGSRLAHENEAPFPEKLAEFFVKSFCPPDGLVLDPFAGSGTTLAVAVREGRRALGCDLRQSQIDLTRRRISGETPPLFTEE